MNTRIIDFDLDDVLILLVNVDGFGVLQFRTVDDVVNIHSLLPGSNEKQLIENRCFVNVRSFSHIIVCKDMELRTIYLFSRDEKCRSIRNDDVVFGITIKCKFQISHLPFRQFKLFMSFFNVFYIA